MNITTKQHFEKLQLILNENGIKEMLYYDNLETRVRHKSYDILYSFIDNTTRKNQLKHMVWSKHYRVVFDDLNLIEEFDRIYVGKKKVTCLDSIFPYSPS